MRALMPTGCGPEFPGQTLLESLLLGLPLLDIFALRSGLRGKIVVWGMRWGESLAKGNVSFFIHVHNIMSFWAPFVSLLERG